MSKIVTNKNNEDIKIEVIRYFSNNDNEYLIYSLNENDDAGYTKLYASKIVENVARIINDEQEWILIKEIIKDIVKNNRDGQPLNIIDLNENKLDTITLEDTRVFKLQGNLVNLLSENKKVKEEVEIEEFEDDVTIISEEEPMVEEEPMTEEVDYEELYKREVDKVEVLENKITDLQEQVNKLQVTIDQIRDLVQE